MNLDEDGDETSRELKPPPKMSEMLQNKMGSINSQPKENLGSMNATVNKPPLPPMPNAEQNKPLEPIQANSINDNLDSNAGVKPPGQANNMFKLGRRGRSK